MEKKITESERALLEKMDKLILERAFTGNIRFKKNKVVLRAKNEKDLTTDEKIFFNRINKFIDVTYSEINLYQDSKREEHIYRAATNFIILIIMFERAERFFNNESDEYYSLVKKMHDMYNSLKEKSGTELSSLMAITMSDSKNKNEILKAFFNINKLDNNDIMFIIEKYIGKESFRNNLSDYLQSLYTNGQVMENLEQKGYINPEEVSSYISSQSLVELLKQKNSYHILRYLQKPDFYEAFSKGYIDARTLENNTTIEDLFIQGYDKEFIMDILHKKVYRNDATKLIWELYEKDYFNQDDMAQIYQIGYLNVNTIIKSYLEEHKRKIAQELNYASISDKKIAEYFSPQMILELYKATTQVKTDNSHKSNSISKKLDSEKTTLENETKAFFRNELRSIYEKQGRDLQRELIDKQKDIIAKEQKESKNAENSSLLDLYKSGLVELSKFKPGELSDKEITSLYNEQNDDNIIIQTYNHGLLSQEEVLTLFEEEELLKIINKGLNANVLQGYYVTANFLEFYKSGKLDPEKLSELKTSFDVQKITEAYLTNQLSYEDLFNTFVKAGIIDVKTATKINAQYDIEKALDKLRKSGGIVGQDIELARAAQANGFQKDDIPYINNQDVHSGSTTADQLFIRNNDLSNQLFKTLGAGERVKVCCQLFDGYTMIPFVDKKIALLEGDGRTYILPIKIVLEQVENRGSEKDLITKAVYRRDLYTNTEYVRTAYHTANWGRNIIKRMAELNPTINDKKLIADNEQILTKLEQQYKKNKKMKNR